MDSEIEVDGNKYELIYSPVIGNSGIVANSLRIEYYRDENNNFHEEIEGRASFLQGITFGYEGEEFRFKICKFDGNLEEGARLGIKNYLSNDETPEDYGLKDCIQTGCSNFSFESATVNCILILEDSIFEKLISLLRCNNLSGFGFYVNYLGMYKMKKTKNNEEYYEAAGLGKHIHIANPNKYMQDCTFGAVTRLLIDSNSTVINQMNQKEDAKEINASSSELHNLELVRHTGIIANTLIIGFIAIFLLILFK